MKPISIKQAQALLGGVSRPTIDHWVNKGLIRKYTIPDTRRVFLDYDECMKAFEPQGKENKDKKISDATTMINVDSRIISTLDESELFLLLNLTNRINGDRYCFPSNKLLCDELKWSRDKLQAVKKRLVEKGIITIEHRTRANSAGQTSNLYHILTPLVGVYNHKQ